MPTAKRIRLWLARRLVPFYVIDEKGRDLWLSGWQWPQEDDTP